MPNETFNRYKMAWTKLNEVLIILSKADCPALDPDDYLKLMAVLLTSSVPGDPSHGYRAMSDSVDLLKTS